MDKWIVIAAKASLLHSKQSCRSPKVSQSATFYYSDNPRKTPKINMPCTKKLINNPDEIVRDSLIGLVATHDHLHLLRQYDNDDDHQDHDDAEDTPVTSQQEHRGEEESTGKMSVLNVVVRSDLEQIRHEQITLISGGGAGHDPAHVGYVGRGMLSAAICGHVFTSPDVDTILTTIRSCTVLPEEGSDIS